MQGWRIEELDPPHTQRSRVVDPMERVGIVVAVVIGLSIAVNALGHRDITVSAPVAAPLPSAVAAATPSPYTFLLYANGMASGGFWCATSGTSDAQPTTPPDRLIVIVSTDHERLGTSIDCAIPGGVAPKSSSQFRRR
jgi:hypothetical protein